MSESIISVKLQLELRHYDFFLCAELEYRYTVPQGASSLVSNMMPGS